MCVVRRVSTAHIIVIKCYLFLISELRFPDKIYSNMVPGPPESISLRMSSKESRLPGLHC